jgi:ABC-2 type transport system permease protein
VRQRIRHIIRKEFRQAFRDSKTRGMLFLPPLIQLLIFGYAVNLDVESARIAWMDQDQTFESRQLRTEFEGSGRFEISAAPENEKEMQRLLDRGQVLGIVRVLPGFARDIQRGRTTSVQVLLDGSNSNEASIVSGYAAQTIARYSSKVILQVQREKLLARFDGQGEPVHIAAPQIESRSRVWFNPDLHSRNYFVPGVVVNIITLVTLSLTAMAIVREKEIGTMEQLMVTPIRPIELILGKALPFVLIGFWDMLLVVAASLVIFHVPFQGSFLLLCFASFLFLLTSLGAGLFISTVSRTQQQAMMATFLFFQPFFMLSGFSFPVRNMPEMVQWLTYLNPVRYFLEIVRGIFLRGSGIDTLWRELAALAIFGVVILTASTMRFHKSLE